MSETKSNTNTTVEDIFAEATTTASRTLPHSGMLVGHCDAEARRIASEVAKSENYKDLVASSFKDSNAMDKLIVDFKADLSKDLLAKADENELKKLLASQQSKRSRMKGKEMTLPNYLAVVSASIAEAIIREAAGKPKGSASTGTKATELLSAEQIAVYKADMDLTNRRIRSLQSWKSTHKHLQDTEEWTIVCKNIDTLVSLRPASNTIKVIKTDPRLKEIREKLATVDLMKMKDKDKDKLIAEVLQMLAQ